MEVYHNIKVVDKNISPQIMAAACPNINQEQINNLLQAVKEGLLAFSVTVGLNVIKTMMEEEVTQYVGPKGKHNSERKAYRHGKEQGQIVLGGRKVKIEHPRVRTIDGKELVLQTYKMFHDEDILGQMAMERMLYGLSTRQYSKGLEPVGSSLDVKDISKSTISRHFIERTKTALSEMLTRRLDSLDIVALYIDGVVMADHTVIVAMGLDSDGYKHILGLWEGATENATICKQLLTDLVDRGLCSDKGLLVIIDGSKVLRAAVRDTFGQNALVQRCQVHKKRNVLDHLPENQHDWVKRKLDKAWNIEDASRAEKELKALANELHKDYPGAAASLLEGLEETLTVKRLGLPDLLTRTLSSTNPIESAFDIVRSLSRNVKRWKNGEQVLRWSAAGLLEAEKHFHRINGYKDIPILREALSWNIDGIKSHEGALA